MDQGFSGMEKALETMQKQMENMASSVSRASFGDSAAKFAAIGRASAWAEAVSEDGRRGIAPVSPSVSRDAAIAAGKRVTSAADFGPILRMRRKELGYTQADVAEMMGFSPRLIGEIERGRGSVGFDRVASYAMSLGLDLVIFGR